MEIKKLIGLIIILLLAGLCFPAFTFAEAIVFKWGTKVEAKIIEKTDDHIKIESEGTTLIYRLEDIKSIDGKAPSTFKDTPASTYIKAPKDIFQSISPAVVYITTQTVAGEDYLGSGFIVDSRGVIVTNYHVIQSAKEINVKLKDGKIYPVTDIIYYDTRRDVCILKINAQNLPSISLGDANALQIGETIYSIGNPLGLEYSFSDGLLSGIRDFQDLKWLQFTAPVSPGNSGGPLINPQGQAVGIVTSQLARGQNINFALAINEIKPYITATPKMTFKEFVDAVSQADYYIMQGNKYLFQHSFDQAIIYFQKALEISPNDPLTYCDLGSAYNGLAQPQEAMTYFQKAIQMYPNISNSARFCAEFGYAYGGLGQYHQAVTYYQKSLQIDPNNAGVYWILGLDSVNLGQYKEAREYLEKAKELFRRNGDYESVQKINRVLVEYSLITPELHPIESAEDEEMIAMYNKALEINPNDVEDYYSLGSIYANLGQPQKAISFYQKAIEIDSEYAIAYYSLAQVYIDFFEGYQKAITLLKKCIEIAPQIAASYMVIGKAYHELGQVKEAQEYLNKAKELYYQQEEYSKIKEIEELLQNIR